MPLLGAALLMHHAAPLSLSAAVSLAAVAAEVAAAPTRINPTTRTLRFVVPLTDGPTYLGDVELAVAPDDSLSVVAPRLLQMLEPILKADVFTRLEARLEAAQELTAAHLATERIILSYDAQKLALAIAIPVSARRPNSLSLVTSYPGGGETLQPAAFSAYLNLRASVDYVAKGARSGLTAPYLLLDGASRFRGIVAEVEGNLVPGGSRPHLRRTGSRLVLDDLAGLVRWTLGDIRLLSTSFQATPSVAGVSVARLYGLLDPSRDIRSSGSQSFTLFAPSTVETMVNGRSLERKLLQPGTYTLQDFPLAEGANDVKLLVEDAAGRQRQIEFNLYSSKQLLQPGATEFFAFAGVYSRPLRGGIVYSDNWGASAFVRRGLSSQLSAGLQAQADGDAQQSGGELVLGTSVGLFGANVAASRRRSGGSGFAGSFSLESLFSGGLPQSQSVRVLVEYRSAHFAIPGALSAREPLQWRALGGWSMSLGRDSFVAVDGHYTHDRIRRATRFALRGSTGFRLVERLAVVGEVEWERLPGHDGGLFRLALRRRFGARGTAQLDADTSGPVRAIYQQSGGRGLGAWTGSVDLTRTPVGTTINANGTYVANRVELGMSQLAAYDAAVSAVRDIRTSFRAGTSIAFADGALAIARPIQGGFLIAEPHRSLAGKRVRLDPQIGSETAHSGPLGGAVDTNLGAYSPKTLIYDVPEAPAGYDLGQGNVQLRPNYRAGYRLEVGSDYNLLVFGRLLDREGEPVSLLAGKVVDLAAPKRPAITMFTARNGRFALQGLRPGRWRIEMATEPPSTYEIDIPDDPSGTVRVGDIRLASQGNKP